MVFGDINCVVSPEYRCDTVGVIYRIECSICITEVLDSRLTDHYIGMTRTSVHNRMNGHLKDQKAKKTSCPLYRHDLDKHEGEPKKIHNEYYRIIGREKTRVRLSCLEAIQIEQQPPALSTNAKIENGRGGIVRISAVRR